MKKPGRRGAALLLVVVIIGLLAFLTAEFQRRSHLEAVLSVNALQALQAQALTRSGYAAAVALLRQDSSDNGTDSRADLWANGPTGPTHVVPVGDYMVSVKIEDQYGKFPVNSLVDQQGAPVPPRVEAYARLLSELKLADADVNALTDALVDWIDRDSSNDRYEYNGKYTVPNAPIKHLSDIARIEGYDRLSAEDMKKLLAHLDARENPVINANTASVPVLMAIHPNLSYDDAKKLYDELSETPDVGGSIVSKYIPSDRRAFTVASTSDRFQVLISSDVNGVVRKAEAIVRRDAGAKRVELLEWVQY